MVSIRNSQTLLRLGKGIAAASIAGILNQTTSLCAIVVHVLPDNLLAALQVAHINLETLCVPLLTGGLLAAEKYIMFNTKEKEK